MRGGTIRAGMNGNSDDRRTFRTLVCVTLLAIATGVLAAPSIASAETLVVFTVDVESNETFHLPDQVNTVCTDGTHCGLTEIVRLLQERQWAGTFFLNVYEHHRWGQTAMREIAVRLQQSGQDVALHTHPHWAYDPARWGMYQYTLDEQVGIVGEGVRLLRAWTNRPVLAHRAGAYAADQNTLTALERNGVRIDSSVFWTYPGNRLDSLGFPRNLPAIRRGVLEVPVTVYERNGRPALLGSSFAPVATVRKIDPNWFADEKEMRDAIEAVVAADLPVLVVFLHSFSLMTATADGRPAADHHALSIYRALLDEVARRKLRVVTMRDLAGSEGPRIDKRDKDLVPQVLVAVDLPRYVWRRTRHMSTTSLGVVGCSAISLSASLLFLVRRRMMAHARTVQ